MSARTGTVWFASFWPTPLGFAGALLAGVIALALSLLSSDTLRCDRHRGACVRVLETPLLAWEQQRIELHGLRDVKAITESRPVRSSNGTTERRNFGLLLFERDVRDGGDVRVDCDPRRAAELTRFVRDVDAAPLDVVCSPRASTMSVSIFALVAGLFVLLVVLLGVTFVVVRLDEAGEVVVDTVDPHAFVDLLEGRIQAEDPRPERERLFSAVSQRGPLWPVLKARLFARQRVPLASIRFSVLLVYKHAMQLVARTHGGGSVPLTRGLRPISERRRRRLLSRLAMIRATE